MAIKKKKRKSLQVPSDLNNTLLGYANQTTDEILLTFHSNVSGIEQNEYEKRKETYGTNIVGGHSHHQWYHSLVEALFNPFSIILMVIAILNVTLPGEREWISFGIILSILFVTCFLKIFQEVRSNKASEKLHDMIETTVAIERDGIKREIPIDEIVPGDIVHLAAGDMVPADLMLLNAKDLFITQSTLTGESEPVEKFAFVNLEQQKKSALEMQNLCFMGTSVSSGSAKAIVLNTGNNTFFGQIAKSVTKKRPRSSFDKGIRSVSLLLLVTIMVMVFVVYILQGSLGSGWLSGLTFALALAVGLTPELLPMIVTVNLAKEAFKLSKQKTIVKNINSIQSFGAMDVLCTDKTGTLTEDRIVLEKHLNVDGIDDRRVLIYGYLNSYFQTGLKNLLDLAIIDKAKIENLETTTLSFHKIDEIPFDFKRRRMSVVIEDVNGRQQLITKGALEEILEICDYVEQDGVSVKLTNDIKDKVRAIVKDLNNQGMRVIAIATNHDDLSNNKAFTTKDEDKMKLIGYIALLDPPKLSARKAILDLQKKGVQVKVLTGDNDVVTRYVCNQVGLRGKKILIGSEIDQMSQTELEKKVMAITIFARLSPEQKSRIVLAIKANKHIVGFMGDGINDATAMRSADLSISVDTAVDIAKENADVILLEKDLTILGNGCVEGRKTYANIIKYIKMTVSSNFGNMLSMLVASIWLTAFLPMSPVQILILNLIYDFAQLAIPWDNVDADFYNKPRGWSARSILKFMLVIGPISSIFDIITFMVMFYGLHLNNPDNVLPDNVLQFQTGWFLESLLTQSAVIIILRSNKFPFHKTYPSLPVVLSLLLQLFLGLILVLTPGFTPVFTSLAEPTTNILIGYIFAIVIGYIVAAQIGKKLYIKVFHQWL